MLPFFLWKTIKEAKLFVILHKKHTAGRNVGLFQHFLLPAVPHSILKIPVDKKLDSVAPPPPPPLPYAIQP